MHKIIGLFGIDDNYSSMIATIIPKSPFPILLIIPSVPDVTMSTYLRTETPVTVDALEIEIPSVPGVSCGTSVAPFTDSGEVTISVESPGVVTKVGHGYSDGREIFFRTTGTLPTGLTVYTHYYVKSPATDTFNVSATAGGTAINTTSAGSGTHSLWTKDL